MGLNDDGYPELWRGQVTVLAASSTGKALLVRFENEDVWIPKSQIHDDSTVYRDDQVGDTDELVLPAWLAREKGLVE